MALKQLSQIPAVNSYIFDSDFDGIAGKVVAKHALPPERLDELLDLVDAVIDGSITTSDMSLLIEQAFGLPSDKAQAVAADVAGYLLLPLENYLPDVVPSIVAWGGEINSYPKQRIPREETDKYLPVKAVVESLQISLTDVLFKRLIFLLQQYAKKDKTEDSLKTFFTRSLNIGGLGLKEEQAAALLAATLPLAAELVEADKPTPPIEKVEAVRPEPVPVKIPELPAESVAKQELEIAPSHELAAEVPVAAGRPVVEAPVVAQVVKPKIEKKTAPEPEIDPNELKVPAKQAAVARKMAASVQDVLASAVAQATQGSASVLKKHKISEKVFADVAGKAIRGLRDIYQTRDIVERDWELKGEDLAVVMQAMSLGVETYQNSPQSAVNKPADANDRAGETGAEKAALNERFSKLTTGKAGDGIEPARTQLTVGSAILKTPEGQRKMVDVVSTARLAGPIEQLGKMSASEFRRLSSSASEAAQKVEDLLSALEATSYEERVKGVLAWRESPMNQLYIQITEEALSQGLALPEIASRRRAAGKDSLSPAEMKALALLNAKIRF